jgi:glutathione peroxidase
LNPDSRSDLNPTRSALTFALASSLVLAVSAAPSMAQRTKKPSTAPTATADTAPAAADAKPDQPKQPGGGGGGFGGGAGGGRGRRGGGGGDGAPERADKTVYDFYLPGPDGKDVPLSNYKDKYIMIVNLGRKSSYNDQLAGLVKLQDTYKDKGLVVIGVPSNEFGAAEPGTEAEILKAYADAKVDFPIMQISKLTGDDQLPFYNFLTKGKNAPAGGDVAWNYTKFIIDKKGNVVARLDPDVAPDSLEMQATIDEILEGTYKPKGAAAGGRRGGPGGGGGGAPDAP